MCDLHTSHPTTKITPPIPSLPIDADATHSKAHTKPCTSSSNPSTLTQSNWRSVLAAQADELGIDPKDLKALLAAKDLDNPSSLANLQSVTTTKDGSGCKLYGPLGVHSNLLCNGKWSQTAHGLKHKNGKAMTAEELASNPTLAMQAGLMHFKNLLNTYKGDTKKAVNHFMTGSPLGPKLMPSSCACPDDSVSKDKPKPSTATAKAASPETPAFTLPTTAPTKPHGDHGDHSGDTHDSTPASSTPPTTSPTTTPPTTPATTPHGDHSGHKHDSTPASTTPPTTSPTTTPPTTPATTPHSDHSGHKHDSAPASTSGMSGDVPVFEEHASGHIGHGHGNPINAPLHNSALSKIFGTKTSIASITAKNNALGAYNAGQPDDKKEAGAYLVANTLLKLDMAPVQGEFSQAQLAALSKHSGVNTGILRTLSPELLNGLMYGTLKNLALKGNADDVRLFIKEMGLNQGSANKLSDQELLNIWATNEHNNLHGILLNNPAIYNTIHITSLNDKDEHTKNPSLLGKLGGFNDKGAYPQWGWLAAATSFNSKYLS